MTSRCLVRHFFVRGARSITPSETFNQHAGEKRRTDMNSRRVQGQRKGPEGRSDTTIFPSITPAATASIATGRHPAAHGVAGMSRLNPDSGQVSNFRRRRSDGAPRRSGGLRGRFLTDQFLTELNGNRLLAPTLMQTASRHGLTEDVRVNLKCPRRNRIDGGIDSVSAQPSALLGHPPVAASP